MEPEQLNNDIVNDYKSFVMENFKNDDVIIPSPKMINIYGQRDDELKHFVINKIVDQPVFSRDFLGSIFPVSYTHLDVYKRQRINLVIFVKSYREERRRRV